MQLRKKNFSIFNAHLHDNHQVFHCNFCASTKIISFYFYFQTTLNLIFMVRFKRLRQEKFPLSSSCSELKVYFVSIFQEKKLKEKKQRDTISLGIMFANKNENYCGCRRKKGKKTNCCCTINHKKKHSLGLWCKLSNEDEDEGPSHERNKYSTRHTRNQIINVTFSFPNIYP